MISERDSTAPGGWTLRRSCLLYLCLLFAFWGFSVLDIYARYHRWHEPFSAASIFFLNSSDRFMDFLHFDPGTGRYLYEGRPTAAYPAPLIAAYLFIVNVFPWPLYSYLVFCVISAVLWTLWLVRAIPTHDGRVVAGLTAVASIAFSYPLWFLCERANLEGVVWAVLAVGFAGFISGRNQVAGVFFALAASMKLFPGVLLLLLLSRKRYRELAFSILALIAFLLAGMRSIGPHISSVFAEWKASAALVSARHMLVYRRSEIGYDHSLFSVLK